MAKAAKAVSSSVVAIVAIATVIVVGVGVVSSGVLNSSSSTIVSTTSGSSSAATVSSTTSNSSVTLSSSSGLNQTIETSNSALGLEVLLSVNSTTIPSEDAISVAASVVNARSTANNLTASSDWPIAGLSSGPCAPEWYPAGITVLRGYYEVQNLSDGRPIFVWPIISCPAEGSLDVTSYSFLPKSDRANFSSQSSGSFASSNQSIPIAVSSTIFAANGTGFYTSLGSALPSTYTLVAGDEWGQIVLMHFEVTPSDILPKVGNFLSSGGGCSPGPCDVQRLSDALVFNCLEAAATPSGCSEVWSGGLRYSASPIINYTVTVWYPSYNQPDEPASANCMYTVSPVGSLGIPPPTSSFGYCITVNSTAFVVSLPQSSGPLKT
jgi:hypothetical protein